MKTRICFFAFIAFFVLLVTAVFSENLCDLMKKEVPIFEGTEVIDTDDTVDKMCIVKLQLAVPKEYDKIKAVEKEIYDFYKETMTKKGWEHKKFKDYGKNGCIMELTKKDYGSR